MEKGMKTAIITHTGSDMTLEYAQEMGVILVSDIVIFGDEQFRVLRDIDSETFFERLENGKVRPTSSQPPISAFIDAYREAEARGCEEILCMMVTSRMSGSYGCAIAARELLKEQGFSIPVYVFDTEQSSHGLDFMAAAAARLAQRGFTAQEIMEKMEELRPNVGIYFIFDSLKYVRQGGRVGAIKALAADALKLKPILVFQRGLVRDVGIVHGYKDGMRAFLKHYREEWDEGDEVVVFHSRMPEEAQRLANEIHAITPHIPIRFGGVAPVMGLYSGPKCIGLSFRKRPLEAGE